MAVTEEGKSVRRTREYSVHNLCKPRHPEDLKKDGHREMEKQEHW